MKINEQTTYGDFKPEASGYHSVGTESDPFAVGSFINIRLNGHILTVDPSGTLTLDGSLITGEGESISTSSLFLLMGA